MQNLTQRAHGEKRNRDLKNIFMSTFNADSAMHKTLLAIWQKYVFAASLLEMVDYYLTKKGE